MIEAILASITPIIVALIGASHLWTRRSHKRVEQKQDDVLRKLTTNHGLEPHQYLEMIGTIDHKVDLLSANVAASTRTLAGIGRKLDRHLDDHAREAA
jgi:hypothetical protein